MATFLPLTYFRAEHNYTGTSWQDFTADLAAVQVVLRELPGQHTASLSFYRANMDPSQSSATTVIKKGDKVRLHAHNASGVRRRMGTFLVKTVSVEIDLTQRAGRQNRVNVALIGLGVAGVAGTGAAKGVATVPELSDVIAGAPYEINGSGYSLTTTAWTGTAHLSKSTQTDVEGNVRTNMVTNPSFETSTAGWAAGANNTIAQDATWAALGTKSVKITPTGASNDTYAEMTFGALTAGLVYSASATIHQTGAQTGTLNSRARALYVSSGGSFQSVQAPNAAGDTRVSVTFTGTTGISLRLYNGSTNVGESVWWDQVILEVAPDAAGGYFDGSTSTGLGTTTPIGTSVEAAWINEASAYDQILLTRDSNPGTIGYEDPNGRIQIYDTASFKTALPSLSIGPGQYGSIDQAFDMSHIINTVTYRYFEKIKTSAKHTREVEHDVTFTDAASKAKYGPFKKTIKTHKKSNFAAHASAIFARNADPASVPRSVTVPIRKASELLPGYEDGHYVGEKVSIVLPDNVTTYVCRVARVQHIISPDSWLVQVDLREQNLIQRPRAHDKVVSNVANTPDGTILTPHIDDAAVTSQKTGFPVVGAVAGTPPPTPKTDDLWIDTSSGNVIKRWNGTTWASVADQAIATAQGTANGKNRVTYSTSDPGTTANTAGDLWFTYSGSIVSKQWQGNGGTSWVQVTIGNTVIANLDAGKITTGFLDVAGRVQADTITTDKLLIGAGTNWVANPGMESGATAPHGVNNGAALSISTTNVRSGANALFVTIGGTHAAGSPLYDVTAGGPTLSPAYHLPVSQGDVIYAEAWVRDNGTAGAGTARVYIDAISAAGARVSNTADAGTAGYFPSATPTVFTAALCPLTTTYQKVVAQYTVPAGVAYVSLNVASANVTAGQTYLVDDMWISKQVTGQLLVNGAIDGKTITGGILKTGTSPTARLEIGDDQSLFAFLKFYSASTASPSSIIGTSNFVQLQGSPTGTGVNNGTVYAQGETSSGGKQDNVSISGSTVYINGTNTGVQFGGGVGIGTPLRRLAFGSSSALTTGATVTITHTLSATPAAVILQPNTNNRLCTVTAKTSTTFTVTGAVATTNAALVTGNNMAFDWVAFF